MSDLVGNHPSPPRGHWCPGYDLTADPPCVHLACEWSSVGECATARERSVAGISNDVPACPVHGPYDEPDDDAPGRDTKGMPVDDSPIA